MISGHMVSISVSVSMVSTSLMSLVCSNVSVLSLLWVSEVKPGHSKLKCFIPVSRHYQTLSLSSTTNFR